MNSVFGKKRHLRFHHPLIRGKKILPEKYLTLPFSIKTNDYEISEGWMYSLEERRIHGFTIHASIDYKISYGTPVLSPCDGIAFSSYHSFPLFDSKKQPLLFKKKQLFFGLGYFIQIYNVEVNRYIQLGHLSFINRSIPFSKPVFTKGTWNPTSCLINPEDLLKSNNAQLVKRGDKVGRVGFSGLGWGNFDPKPTRRVYKKQSERRSYDEPHLHFEEFGRDSQGTKRWQRDPYDIYLTRNNYQNVKKKCKIGSENLFFMDKEGLPFFADEKINQNLK